MPTTQAPISTTPLPKRTNRKLAITVLSGGPSGEREISLQSGRCVAEALRSLGHDVFLEDIAPDNLRALDRDVDCIFVALHGAFGEDGQLQAILDCRGLAYCGSGPAACALAMNKAAAKKRFGELGIPTPAYSAVTPANLPETAARLAAPVVVKPITEGSSLSCRIVREADEIVPAAAHVVERYGECLVEEYIPGREVTVSIVQDRVLPPIEIRTRREFYDYAAKYLDDDTEYLFDIDLPRETLKQIAAWSLTAHRGLGCRDLSRMDWRVDDRCLQPFLLEVNVIPGLTSHSLLPKAAQHAGLNLPILFEQLVESAIQRRCR